jgi:hypothetical protein
MLFSTDAFSALMVPARAYGDDNFRGRGKVQVQRFTIVHTYYAVGTRASFRFAPEDELHLAGTQSILGDAADFGA